MLSLVILGSAKVQGKKTSLNNYGFVTNVFVYVLTTLFTLQVYLASIKMYGISL